MICGVDRGVEIALLGVKVEDFLPIGLDHRRREHGARLGLDLGLDVVVAELLVALERDLVDQRVFRHVHDEHVALAAELHILEQAGGEQRLHAAVEPVGIERIAGPDQHVGADGPRLDPLIADHLDRLDRAGPSQYPAARPAAGGGNAAAVPMAEEERRSVGAGGGCDDTIIKTGGQKPRDRTQLQAAGLPHSRARRAAFCGGARRTVRVAAIDIQADETRRQPTTRRPAASTFVHREVIPAGSAAARIYMMAITRPDRLGAAIRRVARCLIECPPCSPPTSLPR